MNNDIRENMDKIIARKMKEIQITAEKYESKVKVEINKVIDLKSQIKKLEDDLTINSDEKAIRIKEQKSEIGQIKIKIKNLNLEKSEALGCDINIGFNDDSSIKSEFSL